MENIKMKVRINKRPNWFEMRSRNDFEVVYCIIGEKLLTGKTLGFLSEKITEYQ